MEKAGSDMKGPNAMMTRGRRSKKKRTRRPRHPNHGDLALSLYCLRQIRGLEQREVAQAAGISNHSLSIYERGTSEAPVEKVQRIISVLGFSLEDLVKLQEAIRSVRRKVPLTPPRSSEQIKELAEAGGRVLTHLLSALLESRLPGSEDAPR
jgi:transcriptional regulator with XRE-family HTH domain